LHSEKYLEVNKRHWDAIAKRDYPKKRKSVKQIRDGYPYLEKKEPMIAPYLKDISGKQIIVLQFGDGLVLLACAKRGAIVTGVDFSSEQIRLAKKDAEHCGVNVTLVEANCQNLPASIPSNHFDMAVAECGIFIWIKGLDAWMENAHRVLRRGGKLVVSDFHPLDIITEEKEGKVIFKRSYFDKDPTHCEYTNEQNLPPSIEFIWKLSDIINAAVRAGFRIDRVEEFYVEQKSKKPPQIPEDFLIVATRE
jgi:ubiquinone/menaquinone biosynthesis C-methylase UbiE